MAGLTRYKGGLYRIDLNEPDGSRPCIRLGRVPAKQARRIRDHVEHLRTARIDGGSPPEDTARWLAGVDDDLREKLVALGLAGEKPQKRQLTVAALVDMFKARPAWQELAPSTVANYGKFFRAIESGLGADCGIADVTEADAENLPAYLRADKPKGAGFGRATAARCCGAASTLFRFATRSRLIDRNPFEGIDQGNVATERRAFVDAETSRLVLDALQGSQWRLLFGLARYGGLRCPSEPKALRWGDVDWENNRFTVNSSKTGRRVVPIFPELATLFDARWDDADDEDLILPMMASRCGATFSSHLAGVLGRLKLEVWPRLFHSMRSTRQTELQEYFPVHVVCAWLGNSPVTAAKHYLQVTEDHFAKAQHFAQQNTPAVSGMDGEELKHSPSIPADSQ